MQGRVLEVLGVVALGLAAATAASAQVKYSGAAPARRHGFWIGVGLAGGSAGLECTGCTSTSRKSGGSGTIRLGGTLGPHWLLGGEIDGWTRSESGVDMVLANAALVASWYPSRTGGFFLKFGVGGLAYSEDDGTNKTETSGGSGIFGLGWDIPLGPTLAITPYLNSMASSGSKVKVNGQEVPLISINPNLVQFGIQLSWF